MKEDVPYMKTLSLTNKAFVVDTKVKYNWFNLVKDM